MESEGPRKGEREVPQGTPGGAAAAAHFSTEAVEGEVPAWEQVESGRFMPRRIRGSFKGRALG
jgi:hypothetical protein